MATDEIQPNQIERSIEQFETLAFHFTQLSKRLSQDREHWAETGKDLTKDVEKLDKTIQALAELEKKLKEQVVTVMQQESEKAAQTIVQAFRETTQQLLAEQIKITANHLSRAVYQASDTLTGYQREVQGFKQWLSVRLILSALAGNILAGVVVYYFLA